MTDRYEAEVQRYPVRGALYGLLIGLSLAYFLFFQFAVFGFDSLGSVITKFVIVVLIGVVLGVAWAYLAPAKEPKEPPPAAYDEGPPPAAAAAHDEGPPPTDEEDDAVVLDDENDDFGDEE